MKLFVCCAILAVASLGQCLTTVKTTTSSEELMALKVELLKEYLREHEAFESVIEKVETVCPGYGRRFENALNKTQQCVADIDENSETMCSMIRDHFQTCSSPVVKVFEECLPEKSKDVPSFVFQAFSSVSDYLCKTDGEHIFELSNTCVRNPNYRTQRCLRKIQNKVQQQYNNKVPSKTEVCDTLSALRGCIESHLHYSCGHVKTREAFLNVFDAAVTSCKPKVELNEIEVLEPKRLYVEEV